MERGDRARNDAAVPGTLRELDVLRLINGPLSRLGASIHAEQI